MPLALVAVVVAALLVVAELMVLDFGGGRLVRSRRGAAVIAQSPGEQEQFDRQRFAHNGRR